ncbi:hypothetical protein [Nannocystis pusilla]|uniref:Uncharacterized protein n=1 Tax=Nannocystis pusilla TaxID=889268 RepID=A0ABS7U0S8_9BACT|nr:hypothetical protein [Nannocystis pusilla]MBZ5714054.1 hypothetical protein [Nannocystis pusilla]
MRDHNETHQPPEHKEHPNIPLAMSAGDSAPYRVAPSVSPWSGDNLEECEEQPCAFN